MLAAKLVFLYSCPVIKGLVISCSHEPAAHTSREVETRYEKNRSGNQTL